MIIYRRTSLLESSAQTLVNTVNCVGVMGKGLAKAFKERHPAMYDRYTKICSDGLLEPGKLWLWRGSSNWVLNFPTKVHWRNPSKLEWIESGLKKFVASYEAQGITDVSFPQLGCGNGGLDWEEVRPLMVHYLRDIPIPVYIHDYTHDIGLPEHMAFIAETLKKDAVRDTSFETFLANIKRAARVSEAPLVDLETLSPFSICIRSDELVVQNDVGAWIIDDEDLRGVWMKLRSGIVTEKDAGWSVREVGSAVLSIMSVLPDVRPLQIERLNDQAELAVELTPSARTQIEVDAPPKQMELSWR